MASASQVTVCLLYSLDHMSSSSCLLSRHIHLDSPRLPVLLRLQVALKETTDHKLALNLLNFIFFLCDCFSRIIEDTGMTARSLHLRTCTVTAHRTTHIGFLNKNGDVKKHRVSGRAGLTRWSVSLEKGGTVASTLRQRACTTNR